MSMRMQRADGTGPFVEITRVGRWTYSLSLVVDPDNEKFGMWMRLQGDRVLGLRRAERRARKRIAEYERMRQWRAQVAVVR